MSIEEKALYELSYYLEPREGKYVLGWRRREEAREGIGESRRREGGRTRKDEGGLKRVERGGGKDLGTEVEGRMERYKGERETKEEGGTEGWGDVGRERDRQEEKLN
jgi:hypothetical protein